jgi:hypothetical protein
MIKYDKSFSRGKCNEGSGKKESIGCFERPALQALLVAAIRIYS